MSSRLTASICSSAGLAAAALIAAGCGSTANANVEKAAARMECAVDAQNRGAVSWVRREYASGRLASRAYLRERVFGNVRESGYLDSRGGMKPLQTMSPQAQRDLLAWIVELEKDKRWSAPIQKAQTAAYRGAHCDSSS